MESFKLKPSEVIDWVPEHGYGVIYLISFDNNKYYVGQTTNRVYTRYLQHYNDGRGKNSILPSHKALHTHKHALSILIKDKVENLDELEIQFINIYHSNERDKGYNILQGGKSYHKSKIVDTRLKPIRCIETGVEYASLTDACKDTGATIGKINYCAMGLLDMTGGYHWVYPGEEAIREFNIFARSVAKAINWDIVKKEHMENWKKNGRRTSQMNIGKHHSEETKRKISEAQIGKTLSESQKRNVSLGLKRYYAEHPKQK